MRKIVLLICLALSGYNYAQELSKLELSRAETLGIEINKYDLNNQKVLDDLKLILFKERQRKNNKTVSIILTSVSVLTTTFGVIVIKNSRDDGEGEALGNFIGGSSLAVGVISAGVSVPLFIAKSKREKERDELMKLFIDDIDE